MLDVDFLVREELMTEFGDLDLDGDVDFQDFLVLSSNFESDKSQTWGTGDVTGDGRITRNDLAVLQRHFGFRR